MEIRDTDIMQLLDKITALRHELHKIPEASMKEHKTKQKIMSFIAENTQLDIVDCVFWFYVVKKADEHKKGAIAFRADMDAVCGKDGLYGHYCGHDGHSSILAGLALVLAGKKTDRDVYLIFQPGEETGEGAKICSQLIVDKNIEEIYGLHNIPGHARGNIIVSEGTFACASTGLEISMHGTPSHAAYPEAGRNPGPALAKLLLDVEDLTERVNEHEGFVLMTLIGIEVGSSSYGVAASEGVLRLTVRGEREYVFESYINRIAELAVSAAHRAGVTVDVRQIERFPATENHHENVQKIISCADRLGLTVDKLHKPMRWSEDFGYYLMGTGGAFFGVGDGEAYAQLHTQEYEFPDGIMENAITLFAGLI